MQEYPTVKMLRRSRCTLMLTPQHSAWSDEWSQVFCSVLALSVISYVCFFPIHFDGHSDMSGTAERICTNFAVFGPLLGQV